MAERWIVTRDSHWNILPHTCTFDFIVDYKGRRIEFNATFARCEHSNLIFTKNIPSWPQTRALEFTLLTFGATGAHKFHDSRQCHSGVSTRCMETYSVQSSACSRFAAVPLRFYALVNCTPTPKPPRIVGILRSNSGGNTEILHWFLAPAPGGIPEIYGLYFSRGGGGARVWWGWLFHWVVSFAMRWA